MPKTPSPVAPLSQVPTDCPFRIVRVDAEVADAGRLKSLGICVGRRVELLRTGDPLIVRVVGSSLGISSRLAAAVQVEATC